MEVINNESVVFFDVDGTLLNVDHKRDVTGIYHSNIDQLIRHKERGFFVIVWSANGYDHAQRAIEFLKLEKYVDQIMSKPKAYFDDKYAEEWMRRAFVDS